MIRVNENYERLSSLYLSSAMAKKVEEFSAKNPDKNIIHLGIEDMTLPLAPACLAAFHEGLDEMGRDETFHGYGPQMGYEFLREAIAQNDFASRGAEITAGDIFIIEGSRHNARNFQELLAQDTKIAVPDPVYPVYVDTCVMAGRTGRFNLDRYDGLVYLDCTEKNGFVPRPPKEKADLIYLCFPCNPTGATATRKQLTEWVDYARSGKALILFDATYEAFIRDPELPHSIYEIPGSREVAVEFRSFSKTAGFSGIRCAYTVIPKQCSAYDALGKAMPLQSLWSRRQSSKYGGVSYPVQKAAAAAYSPEGKKQIRETIDYYLENAKIILQKFTELGYTCMGGDNSPYVWVKTFGDSWDFFDALLEKAQLVVTPGSGFGRCGAGYVRISAFNRRENVLEAAQRISKIRI